MSAGDDLLPQIMDDLGSDIADQVADQVAQQMGPSLESMTPEEAVEKYFKSRNLKSGTEDTHRSSLRFFVEWCDKENISDISDLTGSHLSDYRNWRRDESSEQVDKLSPKTVQSQQKITRKFIEYCESWEVVREGLHECVLVPSLDDEDEIRDQILPSERAKEILSWLRKYEYASVQHVVILLLAGCGARVGGIHSLDLKDYDTDDEGAYLKFRHRPETETTLKNGEKGERDVDIPRSVSEVLDDYIEDTRKSQTDDYGREPLLTTQYGRLSQSTIRHYTYAWTRPCAVGKECPYGRDPEECDAAKRKNWAFRCPDSLSCHPIRKGYITKKLSAGVPKAVLSGRCDVEEDVMTKHYDHRSEEDKMKARRNALRLALEAGEGYGE